VSVLSEEIITSDISLYARGLILL